LTCKTTPDLPGIRGKGKVDMPNARNILNVTFEEATEKIRGMRRAEVVVRFHYQNNDDEEVIVKPIRSSTL